MQIETLEESVEVADQNQATETPGNLTQDDLLNFLSDESTEDKAPEPTESSEEEEAESEEVLSQSDEQAEDPEDSEEEDEDQEDQEETPKSVQKLLKQISRLTARAKTSEEKVEQLSTQLESMSLEKKVEENPSIEEVTTFDDLEKLRKEALSAKKWARLHEDENYVQDGDREYTREEIKKIRDSAEEHLEELIPERMKFLQQKANSEQLALEDFPFLKKEGSRQLEILGNMNADKHLKALDKLPNGLYLKSLMIEGILSVEQRRKGKSVKPVKKGKLTPPSVPTSDSSPPVRKTASESDRRKRILGDSNISESQLSAFLS